MAEFYSTKGLSDMCAHVCNMFPSIPPYHECIALPLRHCSCDVHRKSSRPINDRICNTMLKSTTLLPLSIFPTSILHLTAALCASVCCLVALVSMLCNYVNGVITNISNNTNMTLESVLTVCKTLRSQSLLSLPHDRLFQQLSALLTLSQ